MTPFEKTIIALLTTEVGGRVIDGIATGGVVAFLRRQVYLQVFISMGLAVFSVVFFAEAIQLKFDIPFHAANGITGIVGAAIFPLLVNIKWEKLIELIKAVRG